MMAGACGKLPSMSITLREANHYLGIFKYALGVAIFLYAHLKAHVVCIHP